MASASHVFDHGCHSVRLVDVGEAKKQAPASSPPKQLLIASPCDAGEYPVVVFLHGYLCSNSFYSQLFRHVASHGFLVVAPQLYITSGPDATEEIKSAGKVIDWLPAGLAAVLPPHVRPDLTKLSISGHSRGGKVAFALALGHAKTSLKLSALVGVDPVDGMAVGKQTPPPILTHTRDALAIAMPVMVIGSGLGGERRNALFPPCAPRGVSHEQFFEECGARPACHLVAAEYGHTDVMDDETRGVRGMATYWACKSGKARRPMRSFVGGAMVAFLKAWLGGDAGALAGIREHPEVSPVELSVVTFVDP